MNPGRGVRVRFASGALTEIDKHIGIAVNRGYEWIDSPVSAVVSPVASRSAAYTDPDYPDAWDLRADE